MSFAFLLFKCDVALFLDNLSVWNEIQKEIEETETFWHFENNR